MDYRLAWWSNLGLEPIHLPGEERGVVDASASPEGRSVAAIVGGDTLVKIEMGDDGRAPEVVASTRSAPHGGGYMTVTWAGAGRFLVRQIAPEELFLLDADGARQPLAQTGQDPSVGPDGQQLALAQRADGPYYSIYVTDLSFATPRKLSPDAETEAVAAWSPDGLSIAYAADVGLGDRPRPTVAWVVRLAHPDGTGQRTLAARRNGTAYSSLRWSPDGRQVAVTRLETMTGDRHIEVMDVESGRLSEVSDGTANDRVLGWLP
jgi:WD40-like Beta Propeller Repeat